MAPVDGLIQKTLVMNDLYSGRISVATPAYNAQDHLGRLLESVLSQQWKDVEMIVSDDGSTDGTSEVAESYRSRFEKKGWTLTILRDRNGGVTEALSRALEMVTGEYLLYPDSDDEFLEGHFQYLAGYLLEHQDMMMVRCTTCCVHDADGSAAPPTDSQGNLDEEDLFWPLLQGRTYVTPGCYMMRSQALFDIYPDRRIPHSPCGQNYQMLLPMFSRHACETIRKDLFKIHIRENSLSHQVTSHALAIERRKDFERLMDDLRPFIKPSADMDRRISIWKRSEMMKRLLDAGKYKEGFSVARSLRKDGALSLATVLVHTLISPLPFRFQRHLLGLRVRLGI